MKQVFSTYFIFLTVLFFVIISVFAVDIGSDTAVTRFSTQQTINNGDRIAGFAAIEAGFKFNGSDVSATFDSFFEASGMIELWLGELILNRDLIFRGVSTITSLGDIDGSHHVMELSSSMTILPDNLTGSTSNVFGLIAKSDSETADVESVDWVFSDTFIAVGVDETSSGDDILRIYHIEDDQFVLNDSVIFAVKRTINSVRWHPSEYILAMCRESSGASEDEIITYTADSSTGVLTEISGLDLSNDVDAIDWHPTGSWIAVGEDNTAQEIAIYALTDSGVLNATPVAIFDKSPSQNVSPEAFSWDSTGDYLAVGLSQQGSNDEFEVFFYDQGSPALSSNASANLGKQVLAVSFNQTYTDIIAIGINALSGDLVEIYQHDATGGTLTKKIGISDFDKPVNSLHWSPDGEILAIGMQPIVGGEFRLYSYDNDAFTVSELKTFEMDGGVLDVRWSQSGLFLAVGDSGTFTTVYGNVVADTECVTFTDLDIKFNNDVFLRQSCVHFAGECVIMGQKNILTLASTTSIILDQGASLQFKDIFIKGVKENNIYCVDDSCTVSLKNATYILDQDYSFTVGKLAIIKDFMITGNGGKIFAYQTDQTSTISGSGRLIIDSGVTFSYDPPIASNDLLSFDSYTSEIFLNGGTLHATSTGMKFTTGRMVLDRFSTLSSEGTVDAEAISFEPGFEIKYCPAANLDLIGGNIVFDNGS